MKWVMLWWIVGAVNTNTSIASTEFATEAACVAAAQSVQKAKSYGQAVYYVCTPTGVQ